MPFILAADIGGTHSRFGFFTARADGAAPDLLAGIVRLRTAESASFAALLRALFSVPRPFAPRECALAVLAVPGPVRGGVCRPPNIAWDLDRADLAKIGFARGDFLNDFTAQAYACRSAAFASSESVQAGRGAFASAGVVAVVGAGTGLGCCALVPDGGGFLAVPSEGGHAAFPFEGEEERAFDEHLRRAAGLPYCEVETVVSGPGLARVHEFLTGDVLSPPEVGALLPSAPRTAEWFARFYGRAVRDYALAVFAAGGVCISGGVAAKNPLLVRHPAFLEEFRRSPSPKHAELLAGIPLALNRDEDFGVYGAALYAARILRHA